MVLTAIALTADETFLRFLDYDLINIKETHSIGGVRTVDVEYTFQDLAEDKELFKLGNKLWIQGDRNLTDTLYVINTKVTEDIYKENVIKFSAEEVLVELNYAPLFCHTELTKDNFHTVTSGGVQEVYIDYNSLDYWFGDYFNIGIVQECLNTYAQKISITGTLTRMNLLRQIEEQTGNIFITRYEKDILTNTIHRYLDFLNPLNVDRNWELHLTYKFLDETIVTPLDPDGNPTTEDKPWEVTRFEDDTLEPESVPETVYPAADIDNDGTEIGSTYDPIDDRQDVPKPIKTLSNLDPTDCVFRIVKDNEILYCWTSEDVGFENTNQECVITLSKQGANIGLDVNDKSWAVSTDTDVSKQYGWIAEIKAQGHVTVADGNLYPYSLPDDSYFEIYDTAHEKTLFYTVINHQIGEVHQDVLDFGYNLENIQYNIDETDTYTAVSPLLSLNEEGSGSITKTQFNNLLSRWLNLSIPKGQEIPMIVQKVNITAASLEAAKVSLGNYTEFSGANESTSRSNWWRRPYNPQDSQDSSTPSNSKWEFYRGTAYWKAPYKKNSGELHITTDKTYDTSYQKVIGRPDNREERRPYNPKMGTTESSDEDLFMIYNQLATYLREHETPKVEIDVDVAKLTDGRFNDYQIYDKVYVKLPDSDNLVTARVSKTSKESHDVAKNSVTLSNYTELNSLKIEQNETVILASNISFDYPGSKTLTVQLMNLDYDSTSQYSVQYPPQKLITFSLNTIENGQSTPTGKIWKKRTDANGYCKLPMKYDPGEYTMDISFGGDEEYQETTLTVKVHVGGTKPKPITKKKTTKSKTATKKITKTTYYDKYGRTPDKKKILAIGLPSASADQGGYSFSETEFKNKCPHCGQQSLVWGIFWAGNESSNWGKFPFTGNYEGGSAEGHIFCSNQKCDADYSCQGNEHVYGGGKKLTVTKARKSSSKSRAYDLRNGKLVYQQATEDVNSLDYINKHRKVKAKGISQKVKNQALSIVGSSTGIAAAKLVASWMDKHIDWSDYENFQRSPDSVLSKKAGNCCDQTRLFLQMCDVAGCTEYMTLKYRHVWGHVYALVIPRKSKNTITVDCASDYYNAWGYICRDYRSATHIKDTVYPNLPF